MQLCMCLLSTIRWVASVVLDTSAPRRKQEANDKQMLWCLWMLYHSLNSILLTCCCLLFRKCCMKNYRAEVASVRQSGSQASVFAIVRIIIFRSHSRSTAAFRKYRTHVSHVQGYGRRRHYNIHNVRSLCPTRHSDLIEYNILRDALAVVLAIVRSGAAAYTGNGISISFRVGNKKP